MTGLLFSCVTRVTRGNRQGQERIAYLSHPTMGQEDEMHRSIVVYVKLVPLLVIFVFRDLCEICISLSISLFINKQQKYELKITV